MSRKFLFFLISVALFAAAVPAAAGNQYRTGEQINLLSGTPAGFPADTAFYIEHGWSLSPGETKGKGRYAVDLYVDGIYVKSDFATMSKSPGGTVLTWVHNFPDGLPAGDHTLMVEWYGPCQFVSSGGCANPNQKVMAYTATAVVSFGP